MIKLVASIRRYFSVAALLLVAMVMMAIATFAWWRTDVYLTSPRMTLVHFWLCLGVASFSVAGSLVRAWRAVTITILLSALSGLALFELYITMGGPKSTKEQLRIDLAAEAAERRGESADRRTLRQVIADLRKNGEQAYPTDSPTGFLLNVEDPNNWRPPLSIEGKETLLLTSIASTTSVYCNESGQWLIYPSDRYGFNNPDQVWTETSLDVLVVGDSFAQGACAPRDKGVAALLRHHVPAAATIGVASPSGQGRLVR